MPKQVKVVNMGKFSIVTTDPNNEQPGYLMISAHGIKVPKTKESSFFKTKQNQDKFRTSYDFFRYGPDDSSVVDTTYGQVMSDCKRLPLGPKSLTGVAKLGLLSPSNSITDNKILTPYERNEGDKHKFPEIERVKKAVETQEDDIWDILVINKETTLEEVLETLDKYNIKYEKIIGYFCNVRADGLDNREVYEQGYLSLNS